MKVIAETIGSTTVLIQTMDDELEIIGEERGGRATQLTGVEDKLMEAYARTRTMIKSVAEDIGTELAELNAAARPKQLQMEFNVGISAQVGPVLILSGKGEYGFKVNMTWEFGKSEQSN